MNEIPKSSTESSKSFEEERRKFLDFIDYINKNSKSEESISDKEKEMLSEMKRHGLL